MIIDDDNKTAVAAWTHYLIRLGSVRTENRHIMSKPQ